MYLIEKEDSILKLIALKHFTFLKLKLRKFDS